MKANIAVCLLSYNHQKTLPNVIDSILNQNSCEFKFFISDDCSTDNTWKILEKYQSNNKNITLLKTPKNIGMAGNVIHAFQFINAKYIALLHHDDICDPNLLSEWSRVLDNHPDIGFVFNQYGVYKSKFIFKEKFNSEYIKGNYFLENNLLKKWSCSVRGTAMIRKSSYEMVGGIRSRFGLLADIDLWMRLSMISNVGYVTKPLIYVHHDRPDDYPAEYLSEEWSWKRLKLLYDIHAENHCNYWDKQTFRNKIRWILFRIRLNYETMKWIIYAVVRNRKDMLTSCHESETPYDLFPLKILRLCVKNSFIKG